MIKLGYIRLITEVEYSKSGELTVEYEDLKHEELKVDVEYSKTEEQISEFEDK